MDFETTNQGRILTSKLHELERERDNLYHQINIEKIQSDYNINSLKYNYRNGNFNDFHDPQSRYLSNIVRLNEKRDKLNSEIEEIRIQLLQEMRIFEEEQRNKKEEKVRIPNIENLYDNLKELESERRLLDNQYRLLPPRNQEISHLVQRLYRLDVEIDAKKSEILEEEEKARVEEEQNRIKDEKINEFINFTNTLSEQEIEEFQNRFEGDEKEQRYRKYKSLREIAKWEK